MKRKIVFISLLTLCLSVSAQQAKEDIRLNRLLVTGNNLVVAGNYLAYPGPLQKSLTRAPKGYKPFISVIMDDTEAVGSSEIATIISLFSC